jgi:hypothetical protein
MHSYTQRSSFDSAGSARPQRSSFDSVSSARPSTTSRGSHCLQDVAEGEPAQHGSLNAGATPFKATSAPMAFGPGSAYFLTGASNAAASAAIANSGSGLAPDFASNGLAGSLSGERSASLPAYLPRATFAAAQPQLQFQGPMHGLQEGVAYAAKAALHRDPRRGSCDFPSFSSTAGGGDFLPPKVPGSRRFSMDSRLQQGNQESVQHLLMGALPGSFNYGSLSESAAAAQRGPAPSGSPGFGGGPIFDSASGANGLARSSASSAGSESASLFANLAPATTAQAGGNTGCSSSLNLGSLYEPTVPVSRPGSGAASPHHNIWSPVQ